MLLVCKCFFSSVFYVYFFLLYEHHCCFFVFFLSCRCVSVCWYHFLGICSFSYCVSLNSLNGTNKLHAYVKKPFYLDQNSSSVLCSSVANWLHAFSLQTKQNWIADERVNCFHCNLIGRRFIFVLLWHVYIYMNLVIKAHLCYKKKYSRIQHCSLQKYTLTYAIIWYLALIFMFIFPIFSCSFSHTGKWIDMNAADWLK